MAETIAVANAAPFECVAVLSLAIGVLLPLLFRYTSDQRQIRIEKDRIGASLLAVRIYPGQLSVVSRSSMQVLYGLLRYLRLAVMPLLYLALPMGMLVIRANLLLGLRAFAPGESFLLTVRTSTAEQTKSVVLILPPEVMLTAPAVHIPADREIVWRLTPVRSGKYTLTTELDGHRFGKSVAVSSKMCWVSPARLRGNPWSRFLTSGETALPKESEIEAMELKYPERNIAFAWLNWNWISLVGVLSLLIGIVVKSLFGIEL